MRICKHRRGGLGNGGSSNVQCGPELRNRAASDWPVGSGLEVGGTGLQMARTKNYVASGQPPDTIVFEHRSRPGLRQLGYVHGDGSELGCEYDGNAR